MIEIGQQIDQFKIIRKIGSGGMGDVYLAEDQKLTRKVALKFLPPDFFTNVERKSRFQREARTAAQVNHQNVTAIYDIVDFTEPASGQSAQYLVMEYVEGKSLKDYLASEKADVSTILRLAEKIAAGLSAAHKLKIVHRDIKADNILIDAEGEPKILDFGLAKEVDERPETQAQSDDDDDEGDTVSKELTAVGKIVGTVTYMSPEQARGERLDTRSDIFSFGVLLYRMATGEFPFSGPTQVSTIAKILETKQEAPSTKNENIPAELERIITKCLQKDPADRYQDTRDLVVDLRELRRQFDSGISDTISTLSVAADGPAKTKRFGPVQIAFVALVAIAALIATILGLKEGSDSGGSLIATASAGENSIAIIDFESSTDDGELQWLTTGLPEILLTDLTESRAVHVISRDRVCDFIRKSTNEPAESYTRDQLRGSAKELGAAAVIYGSFYRLGDKIRIDARMERTDDGEVLWSQKVSGSDEDLFTLVDSLTAKIAAELNISDFMPTEQRVAAVTTFSPEAYRHYHEGMRFYDAELFDSARAEFNKAIEIDSTFALPYMRIGMTYEQIGKRKNLLEYFNLARRYEDRLPIKERSLLDIYIDVVQNSDYTSGLAKLETYIKNYPDDKEARTIYGIFQNLAYNDTAAAFAQFRRVLDQDPGYQFALSLYANGLEQYGRTQEAVDVIETLLRFHPESPEPYRKLTTLYSNLARTDEAIQSAHRMLKRFPDHASPLFSLYQLFIVKRQFDSARYYLDLYSQDDTTDYTKWRTYYQGLASLAHWRGQFREGHEALLKALEYSLKNQDPTAIMGSYTTLAGARWIVGDLAGMRKYSREIGNHLSGVVFQDISYPLSQIAMDYDYGKQLKPVFDSLSGAMRAQLPKGMWVIVDGLEDLYYGFYNYDTARAIHGLELLNSDPKYRNSGNIRRAGELLTLTGRYEEAIETLTPLLSGKREQTGGLNVPLIHYWLGLSYEGVGDTKRAVEHYEEMLKYWGRPDIEIKQIEDARKRLKALTS